MISVKEITKKAETFYLPFLKAFFLNEIYFPKIIPSDKNVSDNFLEMMKELGQLIECSKERKGYGYSVTLREINTKRHGIQSLPIQINFNNQTDFLKFIKKESEFNNFQEDIKFIVESLPELTNWIVPNIKSIISNSGKWQDLIIVCQYFIQNPKPNLYIRELPIESIHSKFIEENKAVVRSLLDYLIPDQINLHENDFEKRFNLKYYEPLFRIRILDNQIASKHYSGINDFSIPLTIMKNNPIPCDTVFIMENKANFANIFNFLTLPELNNCIALFGSGFKVSSLRNIDWLKDKKIYYWGDIDAQGFEILNQLRSFLPNAKAIMMDFETLNEFEKISGTGTLTTISDLSYLNDIEKKLYQYLVETNKRLEQERINQSYVNKILFKIINYQS